MRKRKANGKIGIFILQFTDNQLDGTNTINFNIHEFISLYSITSR